MPATPIQRASRSAYSKYDNIRLFRDDLEMLIAKLEGAGMKVTFSDDDFSYDVIDDIQPRTGSRPKKLLITGSKDRYSAVEIELEKKTARLRATSLNDLGPIPYEVGAFLASRSKGWINRLDAPWMYGLYAGALSLYFMASRHDVQYASLAVSVALFGMWLFGRTARLLFCGVDLSRAHEAGILRRNRDAVIAVISVLIGAGVTILGEWLLRGSK